MEDEGWRIKDEALSGDTWAWGHVDTGRCRAQRETGNRMGCIAWGRAVIAMTAVRIRAYVEPGRVTDLSDVRPPTDVMSITSLPMAPANHPVSGLPLIVCASIR